MQSNDWCSKYQKWGVLQSSLAREQARQTALAQQQAKLAEQKSLEQEKNRERWQLESEKMAIEKERAELERARWYLTLTPEEQRKYDEEQAQKIEQDEIKRNQTENEKSTPMIERNEISQKQTKKKRKKVITIIISAVILPIIIYISAIAGINAIRKANVEKLFNESTTGQIVNYIHSKSGGKDTYSFSTKFEEIAITFTIRYSEEGFSEGFGNKAWIDGGKHKFLAYSTVAARNDYSYSLSGGGIIFNWDALKDMKDLFLIGEVHYDKNIVFNHYQAYNKGICPEITYNEVWHSYGKWDNSLDLDEAKKVGWDACEMSIVFLETISNEVFYSNLW